MDPSIFVQNNNFSGNSKELAKVLGAVRKAPKSFTLTIPWNSAKLVKISPGIIARLHHTGSETNGIAERAVRRVKEGTSAVLLQLGLDEKWVGLSCGMLLLSAKCPESAGRWENSL